MMNINRGKGVFLSARSARGVIASVFGVKQSHLLAFGMVLCLLWVYPAQGAIQQVDRVGHPSLVWVQVRQGIVEEPSLRIPADRLLVAMGDAEEEYHPEEGESEESIQQKVEALKAEKAKRSGQGIPLVTPDQGGETPTVDLSGNEPTLPNPKELPPEDGIGPPRPIENVPIIP